MTPRPGLPDAGARRPQRRIALFDSGLGGLTVLKAVRSSMPDADIVYAGDTARAPYGDRALEQVASFARQMIAHLRMHHPGLLIAACGTSCSAFDTLGYVVPDLAMLSIVDCAVQAVRQAPSHHVGVIATAATIGSGIFQRKLQAALPQASVTAVAAPGLVPLVESGQWKTAQAKDAVALACQGLVAARCDTVILGCTHYPLLQSWFALALGPHVALIDPALQCAVEASSLLADLPKAAGSLRFEVSGDPGRFAQAAKALIGVWAQSVVRVDFQASPGDTQPATAPRASRL